MSPMSCLVRAVHTLNHGLNVGATQQRSLFAHGPCPFRPLVAPMNGGTSTTRHSLGETQRRIFIQYKKIHHRSYIQHGETRCKICQNGWRNLRNIWWAQNLQLLQGKTHYCSGATLSSSSANRWFWVAKCVHTVAKGPELRSVRTVKD